MGDRDVIDVPLRRLRGDGVYRRRYRLEASAGRVSAALEDDFHAFAVSLSHDGARVTAIDGEARRVPWTTCPGALRPLRALRGAPLARDLDALAASVETSAQCTHWFDLACLAIAHACAGRASRVYDVAVDEPREGARRAELRIDGELRLVWDVDQTVVRSSGPFRDVALVGGPFRGALAAIADLDAREAVWVLRKGVLISFARLYEMDGVKVPAAFGAAIGASCHTFRPEVVAQAARVVGATRDFSDDPDAPLGADRAQRRS